MVNKTFNYEDSFMGVREEKHKSFFRSFKEDYRLRTLTKTITLKKGKMLDIGCGGGILTESLSYYYPRVSIFGCDVSKTAIKYARKLGSGKVKYGCIKNKRFPYRDNMFDACICFDVLEHVPDIRFFLKEIKRVLKKNGEILFIVPCEGEPLTFTWLFQKINFGENLTRRYLGHIHPEFTHVGVIKLLEENGFDVQKKYYSEHAFYQIIQFFVLFLPKLLLELFLGENKANEYTNSNIIKSSRKGLLVDVRNLWYRVWDFMMFYPMNWETVILQKIPPTAWKVHVLAKKV